MPESKKGCFLLLAAFAGTIYGALIGSQVAYGSGVGIVIGAIAGLLFGTPAIAQIVLATAVSLFRPGPDSTEGHDRLTMQIGSILLVIIILSGLVGLLFAPIRS